MSVGSWPISCGAKYCVDEVPRGELVLAAPARRAGGLAQADDARVRVHLDQQERRGRVRPAAAGLDRQVGLDRDADGDGFDGGDLHRVPGRF